MSESTYQEWLDTVMDILSQMIINEYEQRNTEKEKAS